MESIFVVLGVGAVDAFRGIYFPTRFLHPSIFHSTHTNTEITYFLILISDFISTFLFYVFFY